MPVAANIVVVNADITIRTEPALSDIRADADQRGARLSLLLDPARQSSNSCVESHAILSGPCH
jgi:hypothetical protein